MPGAPENCIGWIEQPSWKRQDADGTSRVSLILATGARNGPVRLQARKPALGVGPGNVPCYIEKTAKLKRAVTDLILSKTSITA